MPPCPTGPNCQEEEQHGRTKLPGQFGKPKVDGTCAILIPSCEKYEWFNKQAGSRVLIVPFTWCGRDLRQILSPPLRQTKPLWVSPKSIHHGPQPLLELYTATSHQRNSWIRLFFQPQPPLKKVELKDFLLHMPQAGRFSASTSQAQETKGQCHRAQQ